MIATRRLEYDSDTPHTSKTAAVHVLPMMFVVEHFSADVLRRARYVPPRLPVNTESDARALNNLMMRAEHQYLGGFHKHRPRCTAESLERRHEVCHADCGAHRSQA